MARLVARNVRRRLQDGEREFELIIDGLSLGPNEFKAIVGPSGCGKTTAMEMLALASSPDRADEFQIVDEAGVEDVALLLKRGAHNRLAALRAQHFGYVLQTSSLLPFLTVAQNVGISQRFARRTDMPLIPKLLRALSLPNLDHALPEALSVGQRQRVAIARALAHRPSFLLADEPTAALDPMSARAALKLCREFMTANGGSMLMITHDRNLAHELEFDLIELTPTMMDRKLVTRLDDRRTEE